MIREIGFMIMIFHIFISIFSARLKLIFVREIFFLLFSANAYYYNFFDRSFDRAHSSKEKVKLQFLKGRAKGKTIRAISCRFK